MAHTHDEAKPASRARSKQLGWACGKQPPRPPPFKGGVRVRFGAGWDAARAPFPACAGLQGLLPLRQCGMPTGGLEGAGAPLLPSPPVVPVVCSASCWPAGRLAKGLALLRRGGAFVGEQGVLSYKLRASAVAAAGCAPWGGSRGPGRAERTCMLATVLCSRLAAPG